MLFCVRTCVSVRTYAVCVCACVRVCKIGLFHMTLYRCDRLAVEKEEEEEEEVEAVVTRTATLTRGVKKATTTCCVASLTVAVCLLWSV
jgi:AICAR transformylase/IMP cyclohydrolase PurH